MTQGTDIHDTQHDKKLLRAIVCSERSHPMIVAQILSFRKIIFADNLGWKVAVEGRFERDEFDTDSTVYCALFSGSSVIGSFRAIRADGPYLASSKFPHLATSRSYPTHAYAWEISRFAVAPGEKQFDTSLRCYSVMLRFAQKQNAVSLVAFCDLAHERMLNRIGIVTERFGEPMTIGENRAGHPIRVVAGEIPISRQQKSRFEQIISITQDMEIEDAVTILGRSGLSA